MYKRRVITSYVFLVICLFMQMAMAFPHHHHADALCVDADLEECTSEQCHDLHLHHHHTDDADCHNCTALCVTKFLCNAPHHAPHLIPHYSFYTLVYEPQVPAISVSQVFASSESIFSERLHTCAIGRTASRRAPPVEC